MGSLPHADVAATLAVTTAVWAYKLVRLRRSYGLDRHAFMKRIFRTVNLTLWQKRKDKGFADGLAAAMAVCFVGPKTCWVGSAGNCSTYFYRDGLIDMLTKPDVDEDGMLTRAAGFRRPQLIPHARYEIFLPGDSVLLLTDGAADFVGEDEMRTIVENIEETGDSVKNAVSALLDAAQKNGSRDNMTACIIKHIMV